MSGRRTDPSALTDGADRLKIGFVLLVGCSGGTIALGADAALLAVGAATAVGLLAGGLLLWYVHWLVR
ncbi:hypothetical protein ACFQGT_05495 [Natrialbaceae archaeon GCM10025810]|uniref:hypothetical protein n=1 Tax=Halovalidus salilacus TaxID=3075124 RepID=UPI0036156331